MDWEEEGVSGCKNGNRASPITASAELLTARNINIYVETTLFLENWTRESKLKLHRQNRVNQPCLIIVAERM